MHAAELEYFRAMCLALWGTLHAAAFEGGGRPCPQPPQGCLLCCALLVLLRGCWPSTSTCSLCAPTGPFQLRVGPCSARLPSSHRMQPCSSCVPSSNAGWSNQLTARSDQTVQTQNTFQGGAQALLRTAGRPGLRVTCAAASEVNETHWSIKAGAAAQRRLGRFTAAGGSMAEPPPESRHRLAALDPSE